MRYQEMWRYVGSRVIVCLHPPNTGQTVLANGVMVSCRQDPDEFELCGVKTDSPYMQATMPMSWASYIWVLNPNNLLPSIREILDSTCFVGKRVVLCLRIPQSSSLTVITGLVNYYSTSKGKLLMSDIKTPPDQLAMNRHIPTSWIKSIHEFL